MGRYDGIFIQGVPEEVVYSQDAREKYKAEIVAKEEAGWKDSQISPKFKTVEDATNAIRAIKEDYAPRDLAKLQDNANKMMARRNKVYDAALDFWRSPTFAKVKSACNNSIAKNFITAPRDQIALYCFADKYVPEEKDNMAKMRELSDKVVESNGNDYESLAQLKVEIRGFQNRMQDYLLNKAEEAKEEFTADMSDDELTEKWDYLYSLIRIFGEGEIISRHYEEAGNLAKAQEVNQKTQSLIGYFDSVIMRMNYLASEMSGVVDYDEYLKLGIDGMDDISKNGGYPSDSLEHWVMCLGNSIDEIKLGYLDSTFEHFGIDPQKDTVMIQSMDGTVCEQKSSKAWELLYEKHEPVFVVPVNDPMAEPVLIQPINNCGRSAMGEKIKDIDVEKVTKEIPPVEKPLWITRALHAVIRAFGGNGFESCSKYHSYENTVNAQKNIAKGKENYDALTAENKIKAAKGKFKSFYQKKNPGKTVEQAHEEFEAKQQQIKETASVQPKAVKDMKTEMLKNLAFVTKQTTAEKLGIDTEKVALAEKKMAELKEKMAPYEKKLDDFKNDFFAKAGKQKMSGPVASKAFVYEKHQYEAEHAEEKKMYDKYKTELANIKKWYDGEQGAFKKFNSGVIKAMESSKMLPIIKAFAEPKDGAPGMKEFFTAFQKAYKRNNSLRLDGVMKTLLLDKKADRSKVTELAELLDKQKNSEKNNEKNNEKVEQKTEQKTEIQPGMGGN